MADTPVLAGRRILVVEDEMMIAMLVEDMLTELCCAVVGPAHALADALVLVHSEIELDAALLDVNLGGQPVFAVADALREKGVPAIFSTGYGDAALRDVDRGSRVLQKPFRAGDLAKALSAALGNP